ncbi:MAG: hypothetical protein ACI84R_001487 [Candidatus Azotimanducaceae bacterium]
MPQYSFDVYTNIGDNCVRFFAFVWGDTKGPKPPERCDVLRCASTLLQKGNCLMDRKGNQSIKTVAVTPGAEVGGNLSSGGALRFERRGNAMTGEPVFSIEDGVVALHYSDGASVYINA